MCSLKTGNGDVIQNIVVEKQVVAEEGGIAACGRNISSLLPIHRGVIFPDSIFHKAGPGWGMQTQLPDDLSVFRQKNT